MSEPQQNEGRELARVEGKGALARSSQLAERGLAELARLETRAIAQDPEDIFIAIEQGDLQKVRMILETQPWKANAPDEDSGWTPLHWAAVSENTAVGALLLSYGAKVNSPDRGDRSTPLHLCAYGTNVEFAQMLLANNADVNARDREDATPLYVASRCGNIQLVQLLHAHGGDIQTVDYYQDTPLHHAAAWGDENMLKYLLAEGAAIDFVNDDGCTPLDSALSQGFRNMADLLISHGAKVGICAAVGLGRFDYIRLLLDAQPDYLRDNPNTSEKMVWMAAVNLQEALFDFLISRGGRIYGKPFSGVPCLLYDLRDSRGTTVEQLLVRAGLNPKYVPV